MTSSRKLLTALLAAALVPSGGAYAAEATPERSGHRVAVTPGGAAARTVAIPLGKSMIVDLPVDARDVLVSNPKVADVVLRTTRRLYVLGTGHGQTDAVFFDGSGRAILSLDIRVGQDTVGVAEAINRLIPGAQVKTEAMNGSVVLSGLVANLADAEKAVRIAERYVGDSEQVLNLLQVAGQEQVMLKVRIVEVQRSVLKELGVSLDALIDQGGINVARFTTGSIPTAGARALIRGAGDGNDDLEARLGAYERVGLVRTLAEPNLTAISGQGATFLAGGEFPVPGGVDMAGNVVVTFRPYGVKLAFTPIVMSKGQIYLKLATEVSDLSNQGSISVNGQTILGTTNRKAETTVELPSGGALMIAGLLQSKARQSLDSLPGLTGLPVLGALFRSRDFQNDETELAIIVTPYLVQPTSPDKLQTPADGLVLAHDADTALLGRINRTGVATAPRGGGSPTYQGPFGYVIE
jgi:pilus assembly protein CpaC